MAREYNIEIKGLKKFQRALSDYPKIAKGYFAEAIRLATLKVEGKTKKRTPVDTGMLRDTMAHVYSDVEGKVFPLQNYAVYVHEGTRYMRARPYLQWGLRDSEREIQGYFERALEQTLDEVERRS